MNIKLNVNGFEYEASFTEKEVEDICIPLLRTFENLRKKLNRRVIIFLAAPPAVGKSTFVVFLEKLSQEIEELITIQSLSLDGFHYSNEFLKKNKMIIQGEERYLYEVKGMPETFNLKSLKTYLEKIKNENIRWPIYDRNLHDVVPDQILVTEEVILIEGNWLLLDEDGWRSLKELCDYSIFIHSDENVLKDRLINRKIKGGFDYKEAVEFFQRSDGKNIQRVMKNHLKADLVLKMLKTGEKVKMKED